MEKKIKISFIRADEYVTMENNIVEAIGNKGTLMKDILNKIFEGDPMLAVHPQQENTGWGYEVLKIEIAGRWGWIRLSDNHPPFRLNPPPKLLPYSPPKPEPIRTSSNESSFKKLLTRLFPFL